MLLPRRPVINQLGMVVPYPSRRQGNGGPPGLPGNATPGTFAGLGIQDMIPTQDELYRHHLAMNRYPFHEGWLSGNEPMVGLGCPSGACLAGPGETVEVQMAALAVAVIAEEKRRTRLQVISTISIAAIAGLAICGGVAAAWRALR